MSKPVVISARIDAETAALLDKVAASRQRSRAWLVADAVKRMAKEEAEYLAFLQEGIDAADSGDVMSHAEMMEWLNDRYADALATVREQGRKAA